jgi:hypothetical protein
MEDDDGEWDDPELAEYMEDVLGDILDDDIDVYEDMMDHPDGLVAQTAALMRADPRANALAGEHTNALAGEHTNALAGEHTNALAGEHTNALAGEHTNALAGEHVGEHANIPADVPVGEPAAYPTLAAILESLPIRKRGKYNPEMDLLNPEVLRREMTETIRPTRLLTSPTICLAVASGFISNIRVHESELVRRAIRRRRPRPIAAASPRKTTPNSAKNRATATIWHRRLASLSEAACRRRHMAILSNRTH